MSEEMFMVTSCRQVDDPCWHRLVSLDRLLDATDRCFGLEKMVLPMWCPSGMFTPGDRIKGSVPTQHSGLLLADFDPPDKANPPDLDAVWAAALALRKRVEVVAVWPSASDTGLHVVSRSAQRIVTAEDHKRAWVGSVPLWFTNLHPTQHAGQTATPHAAQYQTQTATQQPPRHAYACLLYTSDAADE